MTLQLFLTFLVGTFIPILNGLITKWESTNARVYLQIVLAAVNGFAVEWLAGGDTFNLSSAGMLAVTSLIVQIATQAGVWRPLGVSEAVKRVGSNGKMVIDQPGPYDTGR